MGSTYVRIEPLGLEKRFIPFWKGHDSEITFLLLLFCFFVLVFDLFTKIINYLSILLLFYFVFLT